MLRNYEKLKQLGKGSYGTVFLVQKHSNKCKYVLKEISLFGLTKPQREEVKNESDLLASMNSPYVVKYIESFEEKDILYIIMEYCEEGDLSQQMERMLCKNKKFTEDEIWKLFIQICFGLGYLHKKKVLHRDMKTLNVFLSKNKAVKIGDLGVSKKLNKTNFAKTFIGTPYYLSPEICEDKPYNEKSDIWALGVILYEMCTFRHPFEAKSQPGLIMKILTGKFEDIPNTYSVHLKEMVRYLLEKDMKKRPYIMDIMNKKVIVDRVKKEKMEGSVVELFPELSKLYGVSGYNNSSSGNSNSGNVKQLSQHEMLQYMNQNGYKFEGNIHEKGKILIKKKRFEKENDNNSNNSKRIGNNSGNLLNKNNSKSNLNNNNSNSNNKGNYDSQKKEPVKLIFGANNSNSNSNNFNSGGKRMINHRIKIVNPNEKQIKEVSKVKINLQSDDSNNDNNSNSNNNNKGYYNQQYQQQQQQDKKITKEESFNLGVTAFINNLHNVQMPTQMIKPYNNKYYNADKEIQKFVGNYSELLDENVTPKQEQTTNQQQQQQQQQPQQQPQHKEQPRQQPQQQQVNKRKIPNQQRKQIQEQKYGYCTSSESEEDKNEKVKNRFGDEEDDSSDQDEEKVQVVSGTDNYGDSGDEMIISIQDMTVESSGDNEVDTNETSKDSLLKEIEDLKTKKKELENELELLIGKDDTKNIIELIENCYSDVDSAAEKIDNIINDKYPHLKEEITNYYLLFFSHDFRLEKKRKAFDDYDKKTKS